MVQYWYQNPETGAYDIDGGNVLRSTTAGSLAFITEEDTVTTRAMYQFNAELSDTQKTVQGYPVDEAGNQEQYTTLNVFFDALYNVEYRNTNGTTITTSGHIYFFGDKVTAPGMISDEQNKFDGKWYKDTGLQNEWEFANDAIAGDNMAYVDLATHTIYLYTNAQVTPWTENGILVTKDAVNGPEGYEYGFTLELKAKVPTMFAPIDNPEELHRYNAAKIEAERQLKLAQDAYDDAEDAFRDSLFRTTTAGQLGFVIYTELDDTDLPALFSINTTGSAYGYEYCEYNLFEDSFNTYYNPTDVDVEDADAVVAFITSSSMVQWRTPYQTLVPEVVLMGLMDADINTSPSAIAFDFDAASDLYDAARELTGKAEAAKEAADALDQYLGNLGRRAVITVIETDVNGNETETFFRLDAKDESGKPLFEKDAEDNYILTFNFKLKDKELKHFEVKSTTGSSVQFIVTKVNDGGADATTVNGTTTHSAYGFLTTGSAYEFNFVNTFGEAGGGGYTPEPPEKPEPPKDPEEIIDDPEVPLDEPEVPEEPVVVPGEEIPEPEVPLGDAPRTGDTNNAVPFMALMMFALCGLVVTRRKFN